ncbi:MAG: DUF6069 family protein [Bacteroidota bacterium]|jgi:hypothetical protein
MNSESLLSKLFKASLPAILFSILLNTGLYFMGTSTGWLNPNYILPNASAALTIMPVLLASVLPLLIGVLLFLVLAKLLKNPAKIFWVICILFLAVSMAGPFTLEGADISYKLILCLMHITPAVSLPYFLGKIKLEEI